MSFVINIFAFVSNTYEKKLKSINLPGSVNNSQKTIQIKIALPLVFEMVVLKLWLMIMILDAVQCELLSIVFSSIHVFSFVYFA